MFFKKKNNSAGIIDYAKNVFNQNGAVSESLFQNELAGITKMVQNDDGYNTNKKLEIYDAISKLSNCSKAERSKYSKKLGKLLK